jgi:hypothetical protein
LLGQAFEMATDHRQAIRARESVDFLVNGADQVGVVDLDANSRFAVGYVTFPAFAAKLGGSGLRRHAERDRVQPGAERVANPERPGLAGED